MSRRASVTKSQYRSESIPGEGLVKTELRPPGVTNLLAGGGDSWLCVTGYECVAISRRKTVPQILATGVQPYGWFFDRANQRVLVKFHPREAASRLNLCRRKF